LQQIAETSARLFGAPSVSIQLVKDGEWEETVRFGDSARRIRAAVPIAKIPVGGRNLPGMAVSQNRQIHIPDLDHLDPSMADWPGLPHARKAGTRTMCGTPLRREGNAMGVLIVYRDRLLPFSPEELALQQSFADQAVIAIENARLFNETREALERQTATAEVLQVISSSPGDLKPVFDQMLAKAMRLCESQCGFIYQMEQGAMRAVAEIGVPPAFAEYRRNNLHTGGAATPADMMRATRRPAHVHDARDSEPYLNGNLNAVAGVDLGGARTVLYVPMIRNDDIVGVINVYRQEVRPFTEEQISLLENFASQAVIAIENTRLFNETKEALERQTATADILRVISLSPTDVQPVFNALVLTAQRLLRRQMAFILLCKDGTTFRPVAITGPEGLVQILNPAPIPIDPEINFPSRAIVSKENQQFPDWSVIDLPEEERKIREMYGLSSALYLPMLRGGECIGVLGLGGRQAGRFSETDIALAESFRDQAVIAIENTRLFNETREALEQQKASADILNVISNSVAETQPAFQEILRSIAHLFGSEENYIFLVGEDDLVHFGAGSGPRVEQARALLPVPLDETVTNVAIRERRLVSSANVFDDPELPSVARERYRHLGENYSMVIAPMLWKDGAIGSIMVARKSMEPFSEKECNLLRTFADQAVIAIQNTRMFEQVQLRTKELTQSLDDLRTAQDRLVQTEKLASLGQLTAGIAHEIKNPLNFVNNFSALSAELVDELNETLVPAPLDQKMRRDVGELTGMLKANLEKVVQHGKRADSIVKNMLQHSRESSGERRAADINALVGESLNLAYHGARAEKSDFEITLKHDFDPNAGALELYPQEITRALLNLISNGFYAATRRKAENGDGAFEPVLSAATKNLGEMVEIRIRDNGNGIPSDVREKMFNPFFTTKPTGEGTGLGLSMTHDIIVKQHGGRIDVETEPGAFTEFKIVLPRASQM
jgi:GAF domain-containing protein